MGVTGLWWSYGWYRDAVNDWAAAGAARAEVPTTAEDRGEPPPFDFDATWQAFSAAAPAWSSAKLSLPKGDKPARGRSPDAAQAHESAGYSRDCDRWRIDPGEHERYEHGASRPKHGARRIRQ